MTKESEMTGDAGAVSWLRKQLQKILDTKFNELRTEMKVETKKLTLETVTWSLGKYERSRMENNKNNHYDEEVKEDNFEHDIFEGVKDDNFDKLLAVLFNFLFFISIFTSLQSKPHICRMVNPTRI